ncbi:hypothetical protein MAR_012685 [Mya arenaria]|uniref:P/Homo B domain-containing protein n=1 Tax=Mya arenaria TaxID=6604 RepID=A0ABY7G6R9_MYAAR|nr:hypothetical protein MAR_012685 [Mya arenaria]
MSYGDIGCNSTQCIDKIEEVLFGIEFVYPEIYTLSLWVVSPTGTVSVLADFKPKPNGKMKQNINTTFRSNQFWGENSAGKWHVHITCKIPKNIFSANYGCNVAKTHLKIYGTSETERLSQQNLPTKSSSYPLTNFDFVLLIKQNSGLKHILIATTVSVFLLITILFLFGLKYGYCRTLPKTIEYNII